MISVRCSGLKLSSDISVRTVSPDAARCAAIAFHIVDIEAVVRLEQHLALDQRARLELLGRDAADAHLDAFAVAEAPLEQHDAAVRQRRRIGDVEAADALQRDALPG